MLFHSSCTQTVLCHTQPRLPLLEKNLVKREPIDILWTSVLSQVFATQSDIKWVAGFPPRAMDSHSGILFFATVSLSSVLVVCLCWCRHPEAAVLPPCLIDIDDIFGPVQLLRTDICFLNTRFEKRRNGGLSMRDSGSLCGIVKSDRNAGPSSSKWDVWSPY